MIETTQSVTIDAPITRVWSFAENIDGWAKLMPGLVDCEVIDANDSRWTLKVGVGALIRTVKVFVHVDRWAGPDAADFTYNVESDPVNGNGTFRARSLTPENTEIALAVSVIGEGPMAPRWEAMGKPLLPKFALAFAEQFKTEIEQLSVPTRVLAKPEKKSAFAKLLAWLRQHLRGNRGTDQHDQA